MPVIEARRLNLPSIFGVDEARHALLEQEAAILPPWASDFAQITKRSAIGALVIQFLAPERL